jgi:hypothetical protein
MKVFIIVIVAFILFGLGALLGGAFIYAIRPRHDPQSAEINSDFLLEEVQPMYRKFSEGKILYYQKAEVLDGWVIELPIVETARGAEYGFVRVQKPPTKLWVYGDGYSIYKFDETHLFVILSDWYAQRLDEGENAAPKK